MLGSRTTGQPLGRQRGSPSHWAEVAASPSSSAMVSPPVVGSWIWVCFSGPLFELWSDTVWSTQWGNCLPRSRGFSEGHTEMVAVGRVGSRSHGGLTGSSYGFPRQHPPYRHRLHLKSPSQSEAKDHWGGAFFNWALPHQSSINTISLRHGLRPV